MNWLISESCSFLCPTGILISGVTGYRLPWWTNLHSVVAMRVCSVGSHALHRRKWPHVLIIGPIPCAVQKCLSLEQESNFSLWNVSKEVNKQGGYRYVDGELKLGASFRKNGWEGGQWKLLILTNLINLPL